VDIGQLVTLVVVIVGVPTLLAAYIVGLEFVVRTLPEKSRPSVRPWIWVAPALVFIAVFLVYPALDTIRISLLDRDEAFVGLANYVHVFSDSSVLIAIRDNLVLAG